MQESWIRRQVWNAGHKNGWLCCGDYGAHVICRRWEHRRAGIAITLSKPTAHADGVSADHHEVGCAPGDPQSDADEAESGTLIEPANRGADCLSRTDIDAIGDEESLAVADPRGMRVTTRSIGFQVETLDEAVAELRAAGVEVDEPAENERQRYVHFRAPDGKLYELVEER